MRHAPRGPRFYPVVATLVALCLVALPVSWFEWSPFSQSLLSALIVLCALPALCQAKVGPTLESEPEAPSTLDGEPVRNEPLDHHFLFNSLATIRYVVKEDPDKARSLILDLSEFLKAKLSTATHHPFHLECALSRAYLKLEEARMEERLRTSWQVEESTRDFQVPIAICQTYLSEIIGQQIRPHTEGGELGFHAFVEDSKLILEFTSSRELPKPSELLVGLLNQGSVKSHQEGSTIRLEIT